MVFFCEFWCPKNSNCHLSSSFKVFTINESEVVWLRSNICKETYAVLLCSDYNALKTQKVSNTVCFSDFLCLGNVNWH